MDKFYENFGKFMLILLIGGTIGGAAFYIGQTYNSKAESPSSEKKEIKKSVVENEMPANDKKDVEEMIVEEEKGTIKGTLGYPSEGIPPLEVYAISTTDNSKFFFIKTSQNQNSFEIEDVDPGTYYVLAYSESNFAGGWTKAVPCGLSVDCNDHSLTPVVVKAGVTTSGIELKDWYAPENFFPSRPN